MSTGTEKSVAEQIADAVLAVDGVTDLYGGLFGEIATYLPGGRVTGVQVDDERTEVHVILDLTCDLRAVAAQVAATTRQITGGPVSVTVEDVSTPAPADTAPDPDPAAPDPADPPPPDVKEVDPQ
ncbi:MULTISPECIES: hypothetical protein [Gordonia]|uniref:hypothetical protein n=1 Tax=Gordonia TaxID=2053 RepID=UPI000A8FAD81|nr:MULTISPECIES: hypothetical protein [Gordonia]WLP92643.1 hypothetical protein Q9K23_10655 [Gordonia sp. NB41Y]